MYISELLNLGMDITVPNRTLDYENLPELPPGDFQHICGKMHA